MKGKEFMGRRRPTVSIKVPETPLEVMESQVFGLELTEEQILAAGPTGRREPFSPIVKAWYEKHKNDPVLDYGDEYLLGC